jgi:predicted O-linked N-acetylglucosamine transferase (SPINDLY family)
METHMTEQSIEQLFEAGKRHRNAGQFAEAEPIYRRILVQQPQSADAHQLLGVVVYALGRRNEAIELFGKAAALDPSRSDYQFNLGVLLGEVARWDEAIAAYQRAVALRPDFAEAQFSLAEALLAAGRLDEAVAAFQAERSIRPDHAQTHYHLGGIFAKQKKWPEAIAAFERATELNSSDAQWFYELGNAHAANKRMEDAATAYRRGLEIRGDVALLHNNLGMALKELGRLDEALACFDRALKIEPGNVIFDSNRVYTVQFHPAYDGKRILAENILWEERHARPFYASQKPHDNDPSPERRLRIGYVSPDFHNHCQVFFTIPLFSNHDHEKQEIYCYADLSVEDEFTDQLKKHADVWRPTAGNSDEQIAEKIRADKIDVLIDLTMHMAFGRLGVFAQKPAPVQITWLAYPGTTGVRAIDYRLTDPYLDPVGRHDDFYIEETIRLPETFWCFSPLTSKPAVNELPALKNGYVTFGCLNNFCKINDGLMKIWGETMRAVPNSRLLMLASEGPTRERTIDGLGVSPDRVQFVGYQTRRDYLATYLQIDLGLDTFPYNGHTSSLDSLWMGVPVVTLVGETAVSRAGLSQTSNLGLTDFTANSPAEFVKLAAKWSGDLPKLAALRAGLREKMRLSPLMDAKRFAGNIQYTYRELWRRWCARNSRRDDSSVA